jgi:hypothetical protein
MTSRQIDDGNAPPAARIVSDKLHVSTLRTVQPDRRAEFHPAGEVPESYVAAGRERR